MEKPNIMNEEYKDPRFENKEEALAYNIAAQVFHRLSLDARDQTLKGDELTKAIFDELLKEESLAELEDKHMGTIALRLCQLLKDQKCDTIKPHQISSIKEEILKKQEEVKKLR